MVGVVERWEMERNGDGGIRWEGSKEGRKEGRWRKEGGGVGGGREEEGRRKRRKESGWVGVYGITREGMSEVEWELHK